MIESPSFFTSVVSHETPSVQLACERRVLGIFKVFGEDIRDEDLWFQDVKGLSRGHPSNDFGEFLVGKDFQKLRERRRIEGVLEPRG